MKRIRNIYCWNHLKDWIEAQQKGFFHAIEWKYGNEEGLPLETLLLMAENNCFPFRFFCIMNGDMYVVFSKPAASFFRFLMGEATFMREKDKWICFEDLDVKRRDKILNAQTDSIWIEL